MTIKTIITATMLVVGLAAPELADAKTCRSYSVTGKAENATSFAITSRTRAIQAATNNWVKVCMRKRGNNAWCYRPLADKQRVRTNRVPNGVGGWNWTATFSGVPCRR